MSLNICVPGCPARLKITETMVCDFIEDPVLGAKVIMGLTLDAFERVRLKICWWTPRVIDSSGFSSAKSIGGWVFTNLRALLLPDHVVGVYYQNYENCKKVFGKYFTDIARRSELYRVQLGREKVEGLDGKETLDTKALSKGASCWTVTYRNGSEIMMPAPNFVQGAKGQAGQRFNDLYIDEWTKVEASGQTGIDDQLIGRTTRHSFNKLHPIYRNHHLFSATAEDTMHPSYRRLASYVREVKAGNPDYALISFSYKDYSDLEVEPSVTFRERHREDQVIKDMRMNKTRSGFLQEGLGIWSKNGKGLYTTEMLERCNALGIQMGADVYCSRREDPEGEKAFYFCGVDPAKSDTKKADDGAIVVLRAVPLISEMAIDVRAYKLSFCYAYAVRQADAGQWSGIIHRKHQHFSFAGIGMDPGGGGIWIQPELKKEEQKIRGIVQKVKPIATLEDEEGMLVMGDFILSMLRPRDVRVQQTWPSFTNMRQENLIDACHHELVEGLTIGIGFPPDYKSRPPESVRNFSDEKKFALYHVSDPDHGIGAQLKQVYVQTNDDGTTFFTKGTGARVFASKVKKDFAYAALMAYARFIMWMRSGSQDIGVPEEDAALCSGS